MFLCFCLVWFVYFCGTRDQQNRGERDAEKRLRVQAENDARRAKAAADQAAAAAAAASRSLKIGEKQVGSGPKDGEVRSHEGGGLLLLLSCALGLAVDTNVLLYLKVTCNV